MTNQDIKDLYNQIKSLYGLKYKTTENVYEEKSEIEYDHIGMIEHKYRELVGTKEVIKTINRFNVIDVMKEIINGKSELI